MAPQGRGQGRQDTPAVKPRTVPRKLAPRSQEGDRRGRLFWLASLVAWHLPPWATGRWE